MEHSEQINEIGAALAKAQGAIENATKDKANPFFKSTYADLAGVWDACRAALSANGLSVVQTPEQSDKGVAVSTMLLHSSGQWIKGSYLMPVSKFDAQSVGSAITYARRYALAAMVGVAPEDDDGNAANNRGQENDESKKQSNNQNLPWLNPDMPQWRNAIATYRRDGNFIAIEAHYKLSKANREKIIAGCKQEDIPQ